jgi:hypothetical protein
MKKLSLLGLLAVALLSAFAVINEPNPLLGKWENTRLFQGATMSLMAYFKADGSYSGFVNKKAFVTGKYGVKHDTLYFYDENNYAATYKIQLFGQDSLKLHVIQDTVTGRREGTSNYLFKKLLK